MRTPHDIAAEAQALIDTSAAQFVPVPYGAVAALSVEFMVAMSDGFADAVAEAVAAHAAAQPAA